MAKYNKFAAKLEQNTEEADDFFVSYSDLVTLLMTFFITMVAVSNVDVDKFVKIARSLNESLGGGDMVYENVTLDDLDALMQLFGNQTKKTEDAAYDVERRDDGIAIRFSAEYLFRPGEALLRPLAIPALENVANTIVRRTRFTVVVEGHTDDTDVGSSKYPSNWELSTARASSVVRLLVNQGVEPERLVAAGFGSTRPIKSIIGLSGKSLKRAREKNRRVEIFLSTLKGKSLKSY
ncbi:MAG: hypothetical protein CMH60_01940 [Myxococcales bacterium]|nr:hypothetical protein [Myxococcales bacterium]